MLPEGTDESGVWRTPPEWVPIYEAAGLTGDNWKYRYVILPVPSQSGKTEFLLNCAGHRLDDGPRVPVLYIGPTETMTRDLVRDRVTKFLDSTPTLKRSMAGGHADKVLQKLVKGIPWAFGWAGSASQLASRPVGLVELDEVDRMPLDVGTEGSPFELADARTRRYALAKVLAVSSPTIWGASAIWNRYEQGTMHMYAWPCLGCGVEFVPEMKHLRYDGIDPDEAGASATVECPHCGHAHVEADKAAMKAAGRYVRHRHLHDEELVDMPVLERYVPDEDPPARLSASFWFSGLVPSFTSWGLLAYKLAAARADTDPNIIQSVINTWFGEPWAQRGEAPVAGEVLACMADYAPQTLPVGVQTITCGVDVQKESLYYAIRGWGYNAESWLLDYGVLHGDTAFDTVWLRLSNLIEKGIARHTIDMTLIDSGYRPQYDDRPRPDHIVYSFCRRQPGNVYPAKGYESMDQPVTPKRLDYTFGGALVKGGVRLFRVDVSAIKRWIHSRVGWPEDEPGRWHLHNATTYTYAEHILAEEEVRQPSGRVKWVRVRRENHWLDCEVLARAAALFLRVDDLRPVQPPVEQSNEPVNFAEQPERFRRRTLF